MTATLLSLISIIIGILGAYVAGFVFKKYSFDLIGNTIAGVFGCIFIVKSFGRLGFEPNSILNHGTINFSILFLNLIISFISGAMGLILISKLKSKFNPTSKEK